MIDDVVVGREHPIENQFSRRYCQTFSCALSSGHLGGSGTMVIFAGTTSLAEVCQPAWSTSSTGWRPGATLRDSSARNSGIISRLHQFDDEFAATAKADAVARRLATIPGIGVLNATALAAAIGGAATFARGRDLAAWLGLVPRQATTGGKPPLLGISKRGNVYLRRLLIHGARAAMPSLLTTNTALGTWPRRLVGPVHKNAATVALANKLARIAWAVLRRGETFTPAKLIAA